MTDYAVVWDLNGVLFKKRVLDVHTLSIVQKLNDLHIDQYICTNTRISTLELWIKEYDIDTYFKDIFSTRKIGFLKPDMRVFKFLKKNIPSRKILLIDDSIVNVRVARLVGLKGIRYTSDQQLLNELKMLNIYHDIKRESTGINR